MYDSLDPSSSSSSSCSSLLTVDVFDRIQRRAYAELSTDIFYRFLQSPHVQKYVEEKKYNLRGDNRRTNSEKKEDTSRRTPTTRTKRVNLNYLSEPHESSDSNSIDESLQPIHTVKFLPLSRKEESSASSLSSGISSPFSSPNKCSSRSFSLRDSSTSMIQTLSTPTSIISATRPSTRSPPIITPSESISLSPVGRPYALSVGNSSFVPLRSPPLLLSPPSSHLSPPAVTLSPSLHSEIHPPVMQKSTTSHTLKRNSSSKFTGLTARRRSFIENFSKVEKVEKESLALSHISPTLLIPPSQAKEKECALFLSEKNHLLARAMLAEIHSLTLTAANRELETFQTKYDSLCRDLLRLHNQPVSIFLASLPSELIQSQNLSAVMRERSVSVLILQYIWNSLDVTPLTSPLHKLVQSISSSQLKHLIKNLSTSSSKHEKLKHTVLSALRKSLVPHLVPSIISLLCYQCTRLVDQNEKLVGKECGCNSSRWAVGALIFLRFLIPSITSLISNPECSEIQKKVAVLISRFLMKLNCDSAFSEYPSSLLNEILLESSETFNEFCDGVVALGKDYAHVSPSTLFCVEIPHDEHPSYSPLYDFISNHRFMVLHKCGEIHEKDFQYSKIFKNYSSYDFENGESLTSNETLLSHLKESLSAMDSSSILPFLKPVHTISAPLATHKHIPHHAHMHLSLLDD